MTAKAPTVGQPVFGGDENRPATGSGCRPVLALLPQVCARWPAPRRCRRCRPRCRHRRRSPGRMITRSPSASLATLIRVSSIVLGVVGSLQGGLARRRVVEDVGKRPFSSQALKNGCQSMYSRSSSADRGGRSLPPGTRAGPARHRPADSRPPVDRRPIRPGLLQRQHRPLVRSGVAVRGRSVVLDTCRSKRRPQACRPAARRPSGRNGRIFDHRPRAPWRDLHRGVRARGWSRRRSAAESPCPRSISTAKLDISSSDGVISRTAR